MDNENALMRHEETDARTMVAAVHNRLMAVRELLKTELKGPSTAHPDGVDYGVIPGTKKLCLLQPGAEKVALMFGFVPSYVLTRTDLPGGHREVTALCTLTHAATGRMVGQASGSASTMESKHRYRGAGGKACPSCGAIACKPSKKEYGGGYYCDQKGGGCGESYKATTPEAKALDEIPATRTENADPADQWNTVDKIAQKRAYVSAVKGASAASEVFTVDIEEDAPADHHAPPRPPVRMPTEKSAQQSAAVSPPQPGEQTATGTIEKVTVKEGNKGGKAWKKYGVLMGAVWYGTFDSTLGEAAMALEGAKATITYKVDGAYNTLLSVNPAGAAQDDLPTEQTM